MAAAKSWADQEASSAAAKTSRGPVCINETADNTGCGAPGDATHLLHAMLAAGFDRPGDAAFGWMYDPETLRQAVTAGVGETISPVSLGGKLDPTRAGAPVVVDKATVLAITDGKFNARR